MKRNSTLLGFLFGLGLVGAIALVFTAFRPNGSIQAAGPESGSAVDVVSHEKAGEVLEWTDEDGHAVVGDTSTPRFYTWTEDFISDTYGVDSIDHGSWFQAYIPWGNGQLVVSWGEFAEEELKLGAVDGVTENRSIFIAMRDYHQWVQSRSVTHYMCVGTYVPHYTSLMSSWDVPMSTIIQFDGGDPQAFVTAFVDAWAEVREELDGCSVE
ncbi:hypothetical protein IT417_02835 [bacterium]|nr:hypothetical protein [bacterium]